MTVDSEFEDSRKMVRKNERSLQVFIHEKQHSSRRVSHTLD